MSTPSATSKPSDRLRLIAAFAAVWFLWGSSFVATKIMVGELPPILSVSFRCASAGFILLVIGSWQGHTWPKDWLQWRHVVVMAVLAIVQSTTLNVLAAKHVASNELALLNASAAFWIVLFGAFGLHGTRLGKRAWGSIALGFGGVAMLLLPRGDEHESPMLWMLVVLLACVSWALATAYFRNTRPRTNPLMFNALQLGCGGLVLLPIGLLAGESPHFHWTATGVASLGFLTICSSCIGYSAFTYLMTRVSPAQLSTYAYVNPLVATLMGWWLLNEALAPAQWIGGIVILASVAVINLPAHSTKSRNPA